jgi:AbrB family looped-hinge helix DNA binding protein
MARVTSKLQVTIPKAIAERYGIEPGEEIEWLPAGDAIRVVPNAHEQRQPDRARRLELFDRATERQRLRQTDEQDEAPPADRGWRREDAYERGRAR